MVYRVAPEPRTNTGGYAVMHDWSAPVDLYCERTSAAFWAEPVNAITNAAFLIAAAAAYVAWRRAGRRDLPVAALIGVIAAIGIGSLVFHTFATRGSVFADVLPIAVFMLAYLALAARRYLGLSWRGAALCVAGFLLAPAALPQLSGLPDILARSLFYLPALLAMGIVALALRLQARGVDARRRTIAAELAWTAAIFLASLVLRSLDHAACAALPIGTHFGWHLLNALVLYRLVMTALRHGAPAAHGAAPT